MDERQMSFFEEGGMTAPEVGVDVESGNEVPPGSLPEEVRDDVDAKLSSGEYVVPADVLRYYGMKFFEDLRKQAKEELGEMDSEGRIGGEPAMEEGSELSPEEMAMLQEVMSQGQPEFNQGGMVLRNPELGYAEGGTVTPFNPDQWRDVGSSYFGNQGGQQGISAGSYYKTYIGPSGETQLILFVDGKPTTPIPEGFKERQEFVDQQQENKAEEEEKAEVVDEDWNDRQKEEEQEAKSWAEDNYEIVKEDPIAFGMQALKGGFGDTLASKAGGLGMAIAGPAGALGGGLLGAASQLSNVADARAAQQIAKAQGLDTTELDNSIEEYTSNFKGITRTLDNMGLATGEQRVNKYKELADSLLGSTTSQTEVVFRSSRSPEQAENRVREIASDYEGTGDSNAEVRTEKAKTTEGTVSTIGGTGEGNAAVSVRSGSAAPTQSSRPQGRSGMAKGGLVKRRKKNTTKT